MTDPAHATDRLRPSVYWTAAVISAGGRQMRSVQACAVTVSARRRVRSSVPGGKLAAMTTLPSYTSMGFSEKAGLKGI
jgi:hypothetical protein